MFNVNEIKYREFGRIKTRGIVLINDQFDIDIALEILLNDTQIENKIEYIGKRMIC